MSDGTEEKTTDENVNEENEETQDETPEYVETVTKEVNGEDVTINYDGEGNPYIEEDSLPEGVESEDVQNVLESDNRIPELGKTLSKYKKLRTEQNKKLSEYENLSKENRKLKRQIEKTNEKLTELKNSKEINEIKGKDFEDIWEDELRKELGLDSTDKLQDHIGTMKYERAKVKAESRALNQLQKTQRSELKKSIENKSKFNQLTTLVNSRNADFDASDVYSYAQKKNLTHLSPNEILGFYEHTHSDVVSRLNKEENRKKSTLRIIRNKAKKPKEKDKRTDAEKKKEETVDSLAESISGL